MRKKWILIILLVVVAGVGLYAYREYHRTNADLQQARPAYAVNAVAILQEFTTADSVAENKYRDKIIAVTGTVKKVETHAGDVTIVLGDTMDLSSLRCSIDSNYTNRVAYLQRGKTVTIKGSVTGFKKDDTGLLGSDVEMNRCVVQQ